MKTRVINSILVAEYDPELHMQVIREEALEEGIEIGMEKGMQKEKLGLALSFKKLGVAIEKIIQATGLSREVIEHL